MSSCEKECHKDFDSEYGQDFLAESDLSLESNICIWTINAGSVDRKSKRIVKLIMWEVTHGIE